jgi:hypothetical protein
MTQHRGRIFDCASGCGSRGEPLLLPVETFSTAAVIPKDISLKFQLTPAICHRACKLFDNLLLMLPQFFLTEVLYESAKLILDVQFLQKSLCDRVLKIAST